MSHKFPCRHSMFSAVYFTVKRWKARFSTERQMDPFSQTKIYLYIYLSACLSVCSFVRSFIHWFIDSIIYIFNQWRRQTRGVGCVRTRTPPPLSRKCIIFWKPISHILHSDINATDDINTAIPPVRLSVRGTPVIVSKRLNIYIYTPWVKKRRHYTLVHIFAKYWPIFTIISPTYSVGTVQ